MTLQLGWYVPTAKHCAPRGVLAASESYVLYSNGSSQRECQLKTFRRWLRKTKAAIGGGAPAVAGDAQLALPMTDTNQPPIAPPDASGRMRQ
jgi:hypothetical protein